MDVSAAENKKENSAKTNKIIAIMGGENIESI
jgi:hypothetical protein